MILIFITDDFDLLRFIPVAWETQGDFSGESVICQERFVGIILTYLYDAARNFEQPTSNIEWVNGWWNCECINI